MTFREIQIRYFRKACGECAVEGLRHVKTLPWLSVVQSVAGEYEIRIADGARERTGSGGFFVAPSREVQDIVHHLPENGVMRNRWIFLDVLVNGNEFLDDLVRFPLIPENTKKLNEIFDGIFSSSDPCDEMAGAYQVLKLLLCDAVPRQNRIPEFLEPVRELIRTRYAQPLSVADLAAAAAMSESRFYPVFRAAFGVSPMAYLNHFRMVTAADLLLTTDLSVHKIASRVGVEDPYYFSRAFRSTFGTSPREYREKTRSSCFPEK